MKILKPASATLWLCTSLFLATIPVLHAQEQPDILIADFEGEAYGEWKSEGDAFGTSPAHGTQPGQQKVTGFQGKGLVNTFKEGDKSTGSLTSPEIKVQRKHIAFLVGGGSHKNTAIQLLVDGKVVQSQSGNNNEKLTLKYFGVRALKGKMVQLRITDQNRKGWGHINVDHIVQTDTKPKSVDDGPIVATDYPEMDYNQKHRPLFHFTSKKNWLNDPNGMMYYDGEYHLFFQHNPMGNKWGNMTWGHAVSQDMVHWEQLPHAILPYGGGFIFSGTGAVDHNNTLGKQKGDIKTLLASFTKTLAKPDLYYQALAYSTDKGRTFELFNEGKAIVPNQGFDRTERDPKLFWHEESKKWVMILWVKRAVTEADKRGPRAERFKNQPIAPGKVRFFTSDNLADWDVASDFDRDWVFECMDFVHLPVDGNQDNKKWLLFDASFDYEMGEFDGTTFTTDKKVGLGDFGPNYYAAQTFNNSPDGRTVVIGWMRGSKFDKMGMPFNQQMSFPTTMELRTTPDGVKLFRWPVKELEHLYTKTHKVDAQALGMENPLVGIQAEAFDFTIAFEPGSAKQVAFQLRDTRLVYDADKKVLTGAGKPLPVRLVDGLCKVRVLIDRGSVEVFVNEGEVVASAYIVHKPESRALSVTATGGQASVKELVVHEVKGFWE